MLLAFRTWSHSGGTNSAETLRNHLQVETGVPAVNGDNVRGLYSFHPGGAQVAFVDGSVQFISDSIDTKAMLALISREGGEVVDPSVIR